MYRERRGWRLLLWAMILCSALCCTVTAQRAEAVDLTKTGGLTIQVKDGDGKAIPGGELRIYQVAKLTSQNGNMAYTFVNGFENSGVSLDSFLADGSGGAELAKALAKNAPQTADASTGTPDASGTVRFSQLELGLYLVVQQSAADRYHALDPFLVTIPFLENGTWVYQVDAAPKIGTAALIPTTTASPTATTGHTAAKLPQTGQLRWPVPVLAGGGLIFLCIGWILGKRQEKQNESLK